MIEITIPKLGLTMEKATILEWHCRSGDQVKKEDTLLVIETEKITYEVVSPADGIVHPVVAEGTVCKVNEIVAYLAESQQEFEEITKRFPSPLLPEKEPPYKASESPRISHSQITAQGRIKASPLARAIARKHGIALETIKGSGPGGRIVKADVLEAIEQAGQKRRFPVTERAKAVAETIPIKGARKAIFDNMWRSLSQSAQLTLHCDASAAAIIALRKQISELRKDVSYNAIFIKIVAVALRFHPAINASVDGNLIKVWKQINIGLAMEKEDSLIVPVIRGPDKKSIVEIEDEISALIEKARQNTLTPDDFANGTFTVSNLGFAGIDYFTPIIRPPESAILGIGRIVERPSVKYGQVVAEPRLGLSLTFDHRIIDGAPAARFLNTIRQLIEEPSLLLALAGEAEKI